MKSGAKSIVIVATVLMTSCAGQGNAGGQNESYKTAEQQKVQLDSQRTMPIEKLDTNKSAPMPVAKPDTARQAPMPVIKPQPGVQPK